MRHTKGPWSVGVYNATDNFRSIEQHSCVCDPETMALIAVTGPAHDRQSQVDADLIATAPELLEACERAEQTIRNLGNGFLSGDAKEIAINEANNLRAAIAKAKGKS